MPKETFYNLKKEKKEKILQVLKEEFEKNIFSDVSVKAIVEKLKIARGSFYQYFESLEDAYFTILNSETRDIHYIFLKRLKENDFDYEKALISYGFILKEILFKKSTYNLYKNWYLGWNADIEKKFRDFNTKFKTKKGRIIENKKNLDFDKILFLKSVVHDLIYRNFYERWTEEEFFEIYMKNINWITKGIYKER